MDDKIYHKIIGRVEQGKIPVYPQLIRQKAITRYKAEKQAELKRKQAETKATIEVERQKRARRAARARRRFHKKQETQRKKAEALKDVRTGGWVRVNPDGSISGAGEAAFSPSEAKERGYGWGTTIMKGGKFAFVPLPKQPSEAQYYGILQWKVGMGHYAHRPQVEASIKKEIEMGGTKYGITAPSWAGGYLKQYEAAARAIRHGYQKAAKSATTPSGYELKKISLAKEGRGLQFEYAAKIPIPTKAPSAPSPRELMAMPTAMTVPRRVPQGGYGRDFAVAESIPRDVTPKPVSVSVAPGRMGLLMGAEATLPFWRDTIEKAKDVTGYSSWQQRKVVEKELGEYTTKEAEYIEKGGIKPVHPSERRPEDIGTITGISAQTGFVIPSPQLPMEFVGSKEYQAQATKVGGLVAGITPYVEDDVYTHPAIAAHREKWASSISGESFTGSETQYHQYQRERDIAMGKQESELEAYNKAIAKLSGLEVTRTGRHEALTKEYSEYETAQKEYERLYGLSVMGKYEKGEERAGKWIARRTPEVDLSAVMTSQKDYKLHPLPFEYNAPFAGFGEIAPESGTGRFYTGVAQAHYSDIRTKPIKYATTTAAFFALPGVLKAGGWALKAARITPTIAKIPVIGKPILKYALPAVGVGLGGAYAGSVGYEAYKAPTPYEKGYITGRTMLELEAMGTGAYLGYKYLPRIGGRIVGAGTEKVAIGEIGVEKGYPVRGGLTEAQVRASFKQSTLAARPTELHAAGRQVVPMETIPKHAVLPGESVEGVYGWHASPFLKSAKVRGVATGSSELPMEYYDPILTGYFLKVPKGVEGYRLFGLDMPKIGIPSAVRTHALGIEPIPKHLKGKARWKWMGTEAAKGELYMPLTKMEYEAGLPVGTKLRRGELKYHTVVEGQRVPISQYEVVGAEVVGKDITTVGELAAKYGEYYKPKSLFTPSGFGAAYLGKRFMKYATKDFTSEYGYPEAEKSTYKPKAEKYKPYRYHEYKYPKYKRSYYPKEVYKELYYPEYKKPYYPKYKKPYYLEYPPSYYPVYKKPPYYPVKYPPYYPPKYPPTYTPPYYPPQYPPKPPPKYPPKYPPTYTPPYYPPIPIPLPTEDKKPRHKKKHKRKEREWYEHHYIPTVQELMRTPKGVGVMAPEMPPLPEITVPKL